MLKSSHPLKRPTFDLQGAFLRNTNFAGASLRSAKLDLADLSGASFSNADFENARMVGTILRGADLSSALNLTVDQLALTIIDETTLLPPYIDRASLFNTTRSQR